VKPVSWYKSLSASKRRRERGCFLIEGARAVEQVLTFHRRAVCELLCTDDAAARYESSQNALPATIPTRIISAANMKSICASSAPQGIAALVQIPDGAYTSKIPEASIAGERVLLLEHIQDPGNVGALIRTAAAFGVGGAIMSGQCADPFSPKAVQSSAGSVLSLWVRRADDYLAMVDELRIRGYKLIAGDLNGSAPQNASGATPHILALGNEGAGLSGELASRCDYRIRIPIIERGAESLNVAAAGAIFMFMLRPQPSG
jgi:TrmH family RNA methyltransferase